MNAENSSTKKWIHKPGVRKGLAWMLGALLCGIVFFLALMVGGLPHKVAGGVAILAFLGFVKAFNRGYDHLLGKAAVRG